ncbi:MAG: FCD domain-containing protein [Chromatiales bacterium]|jgi:DNA-binding GntR family transcriptional regulator|nr:FCD domain-containing protein [Chromatiales bacterium]MDX9766555.1 FCD domain-containing protein [Ectothiorhodospiraceae bacterium]
MAGIPDLEVFAPEPARGRADATASPRTLTDLAYARLRDDIVHGRLEPGAKLRVEHLKKLYGVGATPLREALSRLTSDGFVSAEGQRGFRVAEMSLAELDEITNLRVVLENLALAQSIRNGDDAWESGVVAAFHRLAKLEQAEDPDLGQWEDRNRDFHLALIAACTSQWLRRFYETLYDQHKRYRNLARIDKSMPRDVHAEHKSIRDAALGRDVDRACAENERHIRRTADVTSRILRENTGV